MIRIVIANQRGGSAKSTTAATLARCFSDRGLRVLVIDADPQGSLAVILGLNPPAFLNDLLIEKLAIRECVVSAKPGLDIICGNRFTTDAETKTMGLPGSEFLFRHLLSDYERNHDAVLIDVAPSISLFQTCAMVYKQNVLVPVDMDILSVQGATSTSLAVQDKLGVSQGSDLRFRDLKGLLVPNAEFVDEHVGSGIAVGIVPGRGGRG
ncbi:cellulose biosynthesis protein BcsQ [Edaphobacter modestus]|uniref:Cellulose biosynthesis protein BcsQ n=1 Tax=Edaphobacter modestus TaxID=388466 RepID=A0A4Q7YX16_9BACT|nr:cellulose biosynthesis protein BcsQ [Edaphobacter modestus]